VGDEQIQKASAADLRNAVLGGDQKYELRAMVSQATMNR
jgi:hypothetical protein